MRQVDLNDDTGLLDQKGEDLMGSRDTRERASERGVAMAPTGHPQSIQKSTSARPHFGVKAHVVDSAGVIAWARDFENENVVLLFPEPLYLLNSLLSPWRSSFEKGNLAPSLTLRETETEEPVLFCERGLLLPC